jgi:hypothetical protein
MEKTRSITLYNDYCHKVYDILPEDVRLDLLKDCDRILSEQRWGRDPELTQKDIINDPFPPEDGLYFFNKKLLKTQCWNMLVKEMFMKTSTYYMGKSNKKLYLDSCWINKIGKYHEEDAKNKLCLHEPTGLYTLNEYGIHEKDIVVSTIYFIQNISEHHGTIIRWPDGDIIIDGRQNSLSIFNPRLYHSPLVPDRKVTSEVPRYNIVMDFRITKIENKNHKF